MRDTVHVGFPAARYQQALVAVWCKSLVLMVVGQSYLKMLLCSVLDK